MPRILTACYQVVLLPLRAKIRLQLPHYGNEEVLQDGYRLIFPPKLAYYAMWDGHGENFIVPCAASKGAEASLLSSRGLH